MIKMSLFCNPRKLLNVLIDWQHSTTSAKERESDITFFLQSCNVLLIALAKK